MSTKEKFLIVGNGFIAPKHVEAINEIGGEVIGPIDGMSWWGKRMSESGCDWVVVLTPNFTHQQIIDVALMNGKKVICEKPLVLSLEEAKKYIDKPVYTIHQLRYLPIEFPKSDFYNAEMNISVHRDSDYFNSWKGKPSLSGGLLMNVGIHYFDLILYHLGEYTDVKLDKYAEERAEGWINGKNYKCHFIIDLLAPQDKQERSFIINNKRIELVSKDNLHINAYRDIISGNGLDAKEAMKSISLIERLKQ